MVATADTSLIRGEDRFLVTDVSWDFYNRFCDAIGERPTRLTFSNRNPVPPSSFLLWKALKSRRA